MEPATADPSLLTDTATSDTTGSVGTVAGVETVVSDVAMVIGVVKSVVSVRSVVVDSVGAVVAADKLFFAILAVYLPVTLRMKEPLTSGEV